MSNVQPLGKYSMDGEKVGFTFEFAPITAWKPAWRKSSKTWQTLEEAAKAAGLWMQVCYDNNFPVSVRIAEA